MLKWTQTQLPYLAEDSQYLAEDDSKWSQFFLHVRNHLFLSFLSHYLTFTYTHSHAHIPTHTHTHTHFDFRTHTLNTLTLNFLTPKHLFSLPRTKLSLSFLHAHTHIQTRTENQTQIHTKHRHIQTHTKHRHIQTHTIFYSLTIFISLSLAKKHISSFSSFCCLFLFFFVHNVFVKVSISSTFYLQLLRALVSISSTFYTRIFRQYPFAKRSQSRTFVLCNFWRKNIKILNMNVDEIDTRSQKRQKDTDDLTVFWDLPA